VPSAIRQNNKQKNDGKEDRPSKRQRRGDELSIVLPQSTVDTPPIPHEMTSLITLNNPTPAMANNFEQNLAVNANRTSIRTGQSSKIAIPSKHSYPFGKDVPRKKMKKQSYVTVRVYKQRKDLEHMDEIECTLMPDVGLDLVALSQELNAKGCQAGRCNIIHICDADYAHCLLKVLDARYS